MKQVSLKKEEKPTNIVKKIIKKIIKKRRSADLSETDKKDLTLKFTTAAV